MHSSVDDVVQSCYDGPISVFIFGDGFTCTELLIEEYTSKFLKQTLLLLKAT